MKIFAALTNRVSETLRGTFDMVVQRLNEVLSAAGLKGFVDRTAAGLDTVITEPGRIPPGIRKRIALARALATGGRLVLFDEPTEALDQEGRDTVYKLLNQLAQSGKTMVICSNDPYIIKAGHVQLDLNHKPVPQVTWKHGNN